MVIVYDSAERKKRLLQESYVVIERLKRLRALNADPRLVGIDPCISAAAGNNTAVGTKGWSK